MCILAVVTLCWPHIRLNALQKKKDKFANKMFYAEAMSDLETLHFAGSTVMFDALGKLMIFDWRSRGEDVLADWFEQEYLTAPYNRWSVTASGIPGADSQQQPVESSHRGAKRYCYGQGGRFVCMMIIFCFFANLYSTV